MRRRDWTEEELAQLAELQNRGLLFEQIASILGRSISAIQHQVSRRNIRRDPQVKRRIQSDAMRKRPAKRWMRNASGYIYEKRSDHPFAGKDGYIAQHRLVMEHKLGRYLKPDEVVHHINGVKDDNRPQNLELMSHGEHTTHHHTGVRRSDETRRRISEKARRRFADKRNHPFYRSDITREILIEMIKEGNSINEIGLALKCTKKTIYNKLDEFELRGWYANVKSLRVNRKIG